MYVVAKSITWKISVVSFPNKEDLVNFFKESSLADLILESVTIWLIQFLTRLGFS